MDDDANIRVDRASTPAIRVHFIRDYKYPTSDGRFSLPSYGSYRSQNILTPPKDAFCVSESPRNQNLLQSLVLELQNHTTGTWENNNMTMFRNPGRMLN